MAAKPSKPKSNTWMRNRPLRSCKGELNVLKISLL